VLDAKIELYRENRFRVTSNDIYDWMAALVSEALEAEEQTSQPDQRKANWKNIPDWLRGFLKRWGWTRRTATNKRAHSAEDLLGDVLGFVLFLCDLRRDNPSEDEVWGLYNEYTTFNSDSVPLAFCSTSKRTIAELGSIRVSIRQVGSGLDKRQFTLHLIIRAMGEQPWPLLIVKGETTKDGKTDTTKRAKEMELYQDCKVHV
jgi:hypothetical protein